MKIFPAPLWRAGPNSYWWYRNRGQHSLARTFSLHWATSRSRLLEYRDSHSGQRCFIIGNGPSLRHDRW
jgi:hypothetical protein